MFILCHIQKSLETNNITLLTENYLLKKKLCRLFLTGREGKVILIFRKTQQFELTQNQEAIIKKIIAKDIQKERDSIKKELKEIEDFFDKKLESLEKELVSRIIEDLRRTS